MWKNTKVSDRLNLSVPIIQGPFGGGLSAVDLVVAVSEAGGLGSFGVHHLQPAQILETAAAIRKRSARPFALNLWLPYQDSENPQISDQAFAEHLNLLAPYFQELGLTVPAKPAQFWPRYDDQIEALLEARPAVFSFVYGIPSAEILQCCKEREIITIGAATTPDEAIALEQAGVDMIVASGFEAGGHRVSFLQPAEEALTGTFALLPQVVDAVQVPVIAAGGIADARGIAAAMMLGASAVQIGTAFLACTESAATDLHRNLLFSPAAKHTALTRVFSGRLARGLDNRLMRELKPHEADLPPYPIQYWVASTLKAAAQAQGRSDLLALWSGQAAPLLKHRRAKALMQALELETTALLQQKEHRLQPA